MFRIGAFILPSVIFNENTISSVGLRCIIQYSEHHSTVDYCSHNLYGHLYSTFRRFLPPSSHTKPQTHVQGIRFWRFRSKNHCFIRHCFLSAEPDNCYRQTGLKDCDSAYCKRGPKSIFIIKLLNHGKINEPLLQRKQNQIQAHSNIQFKTALMQLFKKTGNLILYIKHFIFLKILKGIRTRNTEI